MTTARAVVVYDGDCVFCSRSMAWIVAHDVHDVVRLTPCTSDTGSMMMLAHGIDPADPSTFLAIVDGVPYVRSAAMLALVPLLGDSVQLLRAFRLVPGMLRDAVYDWTARHRRSLMRGICPVPNEAMRRRMLP